ITLVSLLTLSPAFEELQHRLLPRSTYLCTRAIDHTPRALGGTVNKRTYTEHEVSVSPPRHLNSPLPPATPCISPDAI
ncbi:hypothetical protein GBAR_LOCUS5590, partial [Geodia barretti]